MEKLKDNDASSLHLAVKDNNVDSIRDILEGNISVIDQRDYLGYTPLMMAAMYGHMEVVKILLSAGANMDLRSICDGDIENETLLQLAIRHEKWEVAKYFLSQAHNLLNSKNKFGETPLFIALRYGTLEFLKLLISSGANISVRDMEGKTFLHQAASSGNLKNFLFALDENKEALNATDMKGNTPLLTLIMWHWEEGKEKALDALLKAGADFTIKDKKGNSPIKMAARTKNLNGVKRLLKMGTGLTWIGKDAQTEILCLLAEIEVPHVHSYKKYSISLFSHPICKQRLEEVIEDILHAAGIKQNFRDEHGSVIPGAAEKQIISALLDAGLNINACGMNGNTPLCEAITGSKNINLITTLIDAGADVNIPSRGGTPLISQVLNEREILELLISAGAEVNAVDEWGNPPLYSALRLKSIEVLELLVASGACVNFSSKFGDSLLLSAVMCGMIETAEYLIEKGADVKFVETYKEETALHIAVRNQNCEFVQYLMKAGADVNTANADGLTPLHEAAKHGCKQCVEMLLNTGANVDALTKDGKTAFHMAAENGESEVMKLLVCSGANKSIRDHNGETALHCAVRCGKHIAFKWLLELGLDPSLRDENGNTVLHIAAKGGWLNITNFILDEKQIPINDQNFDGKTPLMLTENVKLLETMLHFGAHTDIIDNDGKTAFHLAAMKNNVLMLKLLASARTNITAKDKSNRTALHWAAICVHNEALEYLLKLYLQRQLTEDSSVNAIKAQSTSKTSDATTSEHVYCVDEKDDSGLTPFMLVVQHTSTHMEYEKTLKLLLQHGANIKACDHKQKTALHIATESLKFEVIRSLISLGADINDLEYEYLNTALRSFAANGHCEFVKAAILAGAEPTSREPATGRTVLHLASTTRSKTTVEYLLSLNVPVDERDSEGWTALHCAAHHAHITVMKCLLEKGHATVDARDNEGMTPLMRAVSGWRDDCEREVLVEILQQAGADFHARDLSGRTPLQIAANHGHPNVCSRLEVLMYASSVSNN